MYVVVYVAVSSDEALFLLATCYYRSGQPESAYRLLSTKSCPTAQCRYLLAQCCVDLNKYVAVCLLHLHNSL